MKKIKENIMPLSLMLSIPALVLLYSALNTGNYGAYSLVTDIDRAIPFLKAFILPYLLWLIYIPAMLIYICVKDKHVYYRTMAVYNIGIIVCFIVYTIFQTTVPRPQLTGDDILTRMVSIMYSSDQPYNCFPSTHCFTSYLIIKAVDMVKEKSVFTSYGVKIMSILIIMSTFFVKQHVIMDAVSAILLCDILFKVVYNFNREKVMQWIEKRSLLLTMKRKSGI